MLGIGVIAFFALEIYTARKTHRAMQARGFGSQPGQTTVQLSPDVQTANCTPSNMTGNGMAMYCNPPGQECAQGTTCADARANYMMKYNPQAVASGYDPSCPTCVTDIGIGGTPIVGSGYGDLANTGGTGFASSVTGMSPAQGYGYGYNYGYMPPQQQYGGYGYSYGIPPPYGYGYGGMSGAPGAPGGYGYGYGMPPPYGYGYGMPPPMPYY